MDRRIESKRRLQSYEPSTDRERGYHRRMLELLEHKDCFSRNHLTPGHFTASAFIVSPTREQLLLIFHGSLHLWLQPGGHIEATDHGLLAAARREALEETGLSDVEPLGAGIFDIDVHAIPAGKQPAHEHFDVRFAFVSRQMDLKASSDALDARWVELDRVEEQQTDESVMRAVRRLRTRL